MNCNLTWSRISTTLLIRTCPLTSLIFAFLCFIPFYWFLFILYTPTGNKRAKPKLAWKSNCIIFGNTVYYWFSRIHLEDLTLSSPKFFGTPPQSVKTPNGCKWGVSLVGNPSAYYSFHVADTWWPVQTQACVSMSYGQHRKRHAAGCPFSVFFRHVYH